jgi:hypothetical protein
MSAWRVLCRTGSVVAMVSMVACSGKTGEPSPGLPTLPELVKVPVLPVAELVQIEGRVAIERDGGIEKASPGPLYEGDLVATALVSRAVLQDDNGRQLELGEETRFRLGQRLATLEVLAGDISFGSDGDGGAGWSGVTVKTPFGTATLSQGAQGRLRFVDGGVTASVVFGEIEFDAPDAGTKRAKAGETFTFGAVEFETPAPSADGARFVVESGRPQIKRPGEKRFVAAKSEEMLTAGTAFQLPPGASGRLETRHARVLLGPGVSGVSEGVRESSGMGTIALSKMIGSATVLLDGRAPAALAVEDLWLGGGVEATVFVSQVGKKKRVEVRAGEVAVTVNGASTSVKAGDAVMVEGTEVTRAPEARPVLYVNAAPRVRIHAESLRDLGLLVGPESAKIEIAKDPQFASTFLSGAVDKHVVIPTAPKGSLFFRTTENGGVPGRSGRIDFLPDVASARDTATRSDVVSETGQKATVFYQSKVPALTFLFSPQPDAKGWRFRLYRADALAKPVVDRKAAETKLVLEPGVLEEGEFLWSATALDAVGNERSGSRMNKLSVVYDNARTSLLIERPLAGERVGPDVKAVGVAPRSSMLFVNGKQVKADESGRFSVAVGAVDLVLFRVVTGESEGYWLRRLKR